MTSKLRILFGSLYILNCATNICFSQVLPIKRSRTISFTTTEGSYMNIDVSPDGNMLLFDLLGDLYKVPATGGTASQLTRGLALNMKPAWSPDGKKIAYISDVSGQFCLNIRDITGKFHRILGTLPLAGYGQMNAKWSPDGNYITIDETCYSISGAEVPLNKVKNPLNFSRDSSLVYYIDSSQIISYDYNTGMSKVISVLPKGTKEGTLSADGRWFVYVKGGRSEISLMIRDILKNVDRELYNDSQYFETTQPNCSFSPDSKYFFIGYKGKIHRITMETREDKIIPFKATVKADLGPLNWNTYRVTHDPLKTRYARSASISPDGKQLAFVTLNRIYLKDLPSGTPHSLVDQPYNQFQPAWSPDGKWIAYVSWCDTVGGQLWRVPSFGGDPEQLTTIRGNYQHPVWLPDGSAIAVITAKPDLAYNSIKGELELVSLIGKGNMIIDETVPLKNQLTFSQDSKCIIYRPDDPAKKQSFYTRLVSRNLDTRDEQVIAVESEKPFPKVIGRVLEQISLSKDGEYIIFSAAEDLYLLPVCKFLHPQILYDARQNLPIIKFATGVDPYWDKNGMVCWNYANHFYSVHVSKIIAAAEKQIIKPFSGLNAEENFISVSIQPDKIIDLSITVPRYYAKGIIALTNATIVTMQGNKVIKYGTILIKNGRVIIVGQTDKMVIPKGTTVIDCNGKTIMPGLIDLHDHMGVPNDILPQQHWMYLANLAYGVTTARDPSANMESFGCAELLQTGQMIGPRLYSSGTPAILYSGLLKYDSPGDAEMFVAKRKQLGGTWIKQYMLPDRIHRQWLSMSARKAGLNVTNEGERNALLDIAMIKDGSAGIEHNPRWGDVHQDVLTFIAKSGTYFTPTLQQIPKGTGSYFYYRFWHEPDTKLEHFISGGYNPWLNFESVKDAKPEDTVHIPFLADAQIAARIRKLGGNVTAGSHGNAQGFGMHNELWALQMGGLSNLEALQSVTIMGAKALGIQKDLGSIEPGKIADLIILNKNPLDDIHNSREIKYVMKDGVLYDGETLDEVWPVQKKCPEWRLKK